MTNYFKTAAVLFVLAAGPILAHDHKGHDHNHEQTKAQKEAAKGYFADEAVAARKLSDWQGAWRSVYPLLQSGQLEAVMKKKAQTGDKTAQDYHAYYKRGYETPIYRIEITGEKVSFLEGDKIITASYADDGYEILTYAKGNRGVRFIFKKTAGDEAAPDFIQFSDHIIAPQKADHYHIYLGDDRAALLQEVSHWPTYYPADLTNEEIVGEMLAH